MTPSEAILNLFAPLRLPKEKSLQAQTREVPASLYLPYTHHVDDHTIKTVEGQFLQVIKVNGFAFEAEDQAIINQKKNVRNTLLKSFNTSDIALYAHIIRRKKTILPEGVQPAGFAHDLNEAWKVQLAKHQQYVNELYLTVVHKQGEGQIRKAQHLLKGINANLDEVERRNYEAQARGCLSTAVQTIMAHLKGYEPNLLGVVNAEYGLHSEVMAFLGFILNSEERNYALTRHAISRLLPTTRAIFKKETIELRGVATKRYAGILSIKEYDDWTAPCMLDKFLALPQEFIMTQSFRFEERTFSQKEIEKQQGRLFNTYDKALTQIDELHSALEESQCEVGYGQHHFTILCWADSEKELSQRLAEASALLGEIGITAVREDINLENCFYAQLPGNWKYITRGARIKTSNFASFISMHNFPHGKARGNCWGSSVTVLNTTSSTPYHFNFHRGDKGNTLVLGPTGSGKTLTISFLFAQRQKFGGRSVYFDKDRGMEIFIRALGGKYYEIKPGQRTGWNPLRLPDTSLNRAFLNEWFQSLLTIKGEPLTTEDLLKIDSIVASNYHLPEPHRQLRHIAPLFGVPHANNLAQRLLLWYDNPAKSHSGIYSWLFDNEQNSLNLSHANIGFDMTHILDMPLPRRSTLFWLFFMVEQLLDGSPVSIFIDEGWRALDDDLFITRLKNFEFIIRKNNGFLVFATQAPETVMKSAISESLLQQSETFILFPNPKADRETYCDYLGLSQKQYRLIKDDLPAKAQPGYFLLKNSHQTVICRLNMSDMDDAIAVLSGNKNTVQLLDHIRAEAGDDPKMWLPLFYQRRKAHATHNLT